MSSGNRNIDLASAKEKASEKRKPPGFLNKLPVKSIIRKSNSKEREQPNNQTKDERASSKKRPISNNIGTHQEKEETNVPGKQYS